MSFVDPVADEVFSIRIFKNHVQSPDRSWANTYEIAAGTAPSAGDLIAAASTLVTFEQHLCFNTTRFNRVVISTVAPDSSPYNPENFLSTGSSALGTFTPGGDGVDLRMCLHIGRVPVSGRLGKMFYRNCLQEVEVSAPAGVASLTNITDFDTRLATAITTSGVDDLLNPGGGGAYLVMSSALYPLRRVTNLLVRGVAFVPLKHAWYNRTVAAPG